MSTDIEKAYWEQIGRIVDGGPEPTPELLVTIAAALPRRDLRPGVKRVPVPTSERAA